MNKKHKNRPVNIYLFVLCLILISTLLPGKVWAQTEDLLVLRLSRDFGYSSGTGRIQGIFTIKASGPLELQQVFFYVDDQLLGEAKQVPFKLRFSTDDFSLGTHSIHALGYTRDGRELISNHLNVIFVSAEEGWQTVLHIMIPILVIVSFISIFSVAFTMFSARKVKQIPPGTKRNYGACGGAICPCCGRPFALHWSMPNLIKGKLARCPFCGKWSILRSLPLPELRKAEQEELQADQDARQVAPMSDEERLRKQLDESRYRDL